MRQTFPVSTHSAEAVLGYPFSYHLLKIITKNPTKNEFNVDERIMKFNFYCLPNFTFLIGHWNLQSSIAKTARQFMGLNFYVFMFLINVFACSSLSAFKFA